MKSFTTQIFSHFGYEEIPAWANMLFASINVIIILILAALARSIITRLLRSAHARLVTRAPGLEERKRIDTLYRIFGYIVSVVIGVITVMLAPK